MSSTVTGIEALATLPAGVADTLGLVSRFDAALGPGFGRLADAARASLADLAAATAETPLGPATAEAVAAIGRGEFRAASFQAIAAARCALLGAVHDALADQVQAALGRTPISRGDPAAPAVLGASATLLAASEQWLADLAIAGFRHLEEGTLASFETTLALLRADPDGAGLAAMLSGFHAELMRSAPTNRLDRLPATRWADLWAASLVRTRHRPGPPTFREVGGALTPLGLDIHAHEHVFAPTLYAILDEEGGGSRVVRVPFVGYVMAAVAPEQAWDLFEPVAGPILEALAGPRTIEIGRGELRDDGSLILAATPALGGKVDPFAAASKLTSLPDPPAAMRHPVHLAEPVHLPPGHGVPLASERVAESAGLDLSAIDDMTEMIGLLRFRGDGWGVQPLSVRAKKKTILVGADIHAARSKLKVRALEVLRERAGRLLRTKS
jgi:hypothetical protein